MRADCATWRDRRQPVRRVPRCADVCLDAPTCWRGAVRELGRAWLATRTAPSSNNVGRRIGRSRLWPGSSSFLMVPRSSLGGQGGQGVAGCPCSEPTPYTPHCAPGSVVFQDIGMGCLKTSESVNWPVSAGVQGSPGHHRSARRGPLTIAGRPRPQQVPKSWISRLIKRYTREGDAAFEPRSRRPPRQPETTVAEHH